jgi:hypothetical protein
MATSGLLDFAFFLWTVMSMRRCAMRMSEEGCWNSLRSSVSPLMFAMLTSLPMMRCSL